MRVRGPLHSIDVRGRFALGPVFSIWRGLNYARLFVVPTNPRSIRQLAIRALLTSSSRAWAALTTGQRTGWETYADGLTRKNVFGQEIKTSGINEFCALYVLASDTGGVPVDDAPVTDAPLLVTGVAVAEGALSGEIDVTWSAGQGGFVDVWITPVLSPGAKAQESAYSHQSYTADVTATVTISGLVPGGKYGVRARQVFANGQVGPPISATLTAKV